MKILNTLNKDYDIKIIVPILRMASPILTREKKRLQVVKLAQEGSSQKYIARKLSVDTKYVRRTLNKIYNIGSIKDRPRTGRPRKLNDKSRNQLVKSMKGRE